MLRYARVKRTFYIICLLASSLSMAAMAAPKPMVSGQVVGGVADESANPPGRIIASSSAPKTTARSLSTGGGRATITTNSSKRTAFSGGTTPASTEVLTKVYKFKKNGIASFSDYAPRGSAYEVLTYGCFACNVNSTVDWYTTKLYPDTFSQHIQSAAATYAVDPALVRAVIHAESGFNPAARSGVGAMGLMQLMPGTAKDMGVSNAYEAAQNIVGGVKYLAYLLGEFKGDTTLATAAYNAGPNNVTKYQGIPPFAETQAYVKRVKILWDRYKTQG